jgi:hypothetical protein
VWSIPVKSMQLTVPLEVWKASLILRAAAMAATSA